MVRITITVEGVTSENHADVVAVFTRWGGAVSGSPPRPTCYFELPDTTDVAGFIAGLKASLTICSADITSVATEVTLQPALPKPK